MLNQHTAAFEPKPRTSLQAHPHATIKPAAALNYFSLSKDNLYLAALKASRPVAQTASTQSRSPRQPHYAAMPDAALPLHVSYGTTGSSKGNRADEQQLLLLLLSAINYAFPASQGTQSLSMLPGFQQDGLWCRPMCQGSRDAAAPRPLASSSPRGGHAAPAGTLQ